MAAFAPSTVSFYFGPQLIGSWLNMMLFTLELVQAHSILGAHLAGRTKLLVVFVLLVDMVGTAGACAHLYLNCVTFWGDPAASFGRVYWPYPLFVGTGALTGAVVHTFLLGRLWQLCRVPSAEARGRHRDLCSRVGGVILTGALGVVAVIAFVGAIMAVVSIIRFPQVADVARWVFASRIWQVSSALADVGLAAALAWKLSTLQTSFANTKRSADGRDDVGAAPAHHRHLRLPAVQHQSVPSLPCRARADRHTVALAGEICLGRAYANTLLLNLQLRTRAVPGAAPHAPGGKQLSLSGIRGSPPLRGDRRVKHADLDTEIGTQDIQAISDAEKAGAEVLCPPSDMGP